MEMNSQREDLAAAVRECARRVRGEIEFVLAVQTKGVLIRPRLAGGTVAVTGYAVAWPTEDGEPVWYATGDLGTDLSLPALRVGWDAGPESGRGRGHLRVVS